LFVAGFLGAHSNPDDCSKRSHQTSGEKEADGHARNGAGAGSGRAFEDVGKGGGGVAAPLFGHAKLAAGFQRELHRHRFAQTQHGLQRRLVAHKRRERNAHFDSASVRRLGVFAAAGKGSFAHVAHAEKPLAKIKENTPLFLTSKCALHQEDEKDLTCDSHSFPHIELPDQQLEDRWEAYFKNHFA
jgi:hypothetical protein